MRTRLLTLLASAVALLACPAAAPAAVTEFATGLTPGGAPADITTGPDGNLWFTEQGLTGGIGRITPAGSITEYVAGLTPGFSLGHAPSHIAAGPDQALWFTAEGLTGGLVGRLDPATGTVTEYSVPNARPSGIALGPDGNLWFTERDGNGAIARITPGGLITEYTTGLTSGGEPTDIVAGPGGTLWFTLSASPGAIGRIDPGTGAITEFSTGITSGSGPSHIAAHSNGKLYFTEASDPGAIGRIKTSGAIAEYTAGLTPNQGPAGIAEGGDGALWFTTSATPGRIGRFSPRTKAISELQGGLALGLTLGSGPAGITRGPDGNVWVAQTAFPGRIARVTVPPLAELEIDDDHGGRTSHNHRGVLEATVTANSQATTYHVEYGPDAAYGSTSDELPAGAAAGPVDHVVDLPLEPGGHYHARVVATNGSGSSTSDDLELWVTGDGEISGSQPDDTGGGTPAPTATPTPDPVAAAPAAADEGAGTATAPAPPKLGRAVVLHPLSGSVRFRAPGKRAFAPLGSGLRVPVGSLVDTRHGRVSLQSARDAHGRTQTGTFWGALFQVRQARHSRGVTDLVLHGGSFARCGAVAGASALARETGSPRRAVRRLWGKDRHSRFRTHGRDSVATVRGTEWVTTDRCDGTLTKVRKGAVLVRDLHRKRSVLLTAGHAYLARHRRP